MIHEKDFADKEKAVYREVVRQNVVSAVLGVLEQMEASNVQFGTEELQQTATSIRWRLKQADSHKAIVDMRPSISLLTSQKDLRDFMESHTEVETLQLNHYLFRSLDKILSDAYAPSDYDIMRVRQKTTGLHEILFHFKGFEFSLSSIQDESVPDV